MLEKHQACAPAILEIERRQTELDAAWKVVFQAKTDEAAANGELMRFENEFKVHQQLARAAELRMQGHRSEAMASRAREAKAPPTRRVTEHKGVLFTTATIVNDSSREDAASATARAEAAEQEEQHIMMAEIEKVGELKAQVSLAEAECKKQQIQVHREEDHVKEAKAALATAKAHLKEHQLAIKAACANVGGATHSLTHCSCFCAVLLSNK